MPLPVPGSPWPPPAFAEAHLRMDTWEAWWSGDAEQLGAHYGAHHGGFLTRPSQYAGGVVGRVARFWWGRPPAAGEPDAKLHCPLAGDICRASADLLFSEPVTASSGSDATNGLLNDLLDDGTQAKLLEGAEIAAALGGVYLRPVYDKTISDKAWLDVISPEGALPEWRWGRLAAVTFWRVARESDGQVWRHFQRYEPGVVVHALYQGTSSDVGRPVPLQDVESTAPLATQVNDQGAAETGFPGLAAVYIPNMLPNRRWRRTPQLAPMGRPDLDGIEPMLDALDETYSSWMRDIRLGKGRILVGDAVLDDRGPGRGASFDPDREAFAVVKGVMPKDLPVQVAQFAIRVEQHRDTAREWVLAALRHAGYSLHTLGMTTDGAGAAVTATEVNARERRSFITRDRKVGYWRPGLVAVLRALLAVDADAFDRAEPDLDDVKVAFADSVSEDMLTLANTADVLNRASAASTRTLVELVHPDWEERQVLAEVDAIERGKGPVLGAPFDYDADGAPTETDDQRAAAGAP